RSGGRQAYRTLGSCICGLRALMSLQIRPRKGSRRRPMRECVDIILAAFEPGGVVVVIEGTEASTLMFPLCDGWVGEFVRTTPTSPVFVLRHVDAVSADRQKETVSGLSPLWRRPEHKDADKLILDLLPKRAE